MLAAGDSRSARLAASPPSTTTASPMPPLAGRCVLRWHAVFPLRCLSIEEPMPSDALAGLKAHDRRFTLT